MKGIQLHADRNIAAETARSVALTCFNGFTDRLLTGNFRPQVRCAVIVVSVGLN